MFCLAALFYLKIDKNSIFLIIDEIVSSEKKYNLKLSILVI